MRKSLLALAVLSSLSAAPTVFAADDAPAVTGNFGLFSDYRFRGISQTKNNPALQGGFDYAHSSGFYVGTWASSISSQQYAGSSGMEWDIYGGYKTEIAEGTTLDVGYLYYYYPGANYKKGGGIDKKYDNQELYVGLTYGPLTGKVSYAISDYFGLESATGPSASGSSKGTMYYDLTLNQEIAPKTTLVAHVGYTSVKNYSDLSYTDYKLGVNYDLNGFILGAAYVGNTLKDSAKSWNTLGDGTKLYKDTVVLSVSKTF